MELFWAHGYEATSMEQLCSHLGISRASLYDTFGSKRDLYLKALDCYSSSNDGSPLTILAAEGSPLAAVRALITRYATPQPEVPGGCFMIKAANACQPDDDDVTSRVTKNWNDIESALAHTLGRAKACGEIQTTDTHALAQVLMVLLQGMEVFSNNDDLDPRLAAAAAHARALLV